MEITEQPSKMGFQQPLAPDLDEFCSNVQEALILAHKEQAWFLQDQDHHFDIRTKIQKHGQQENTESVVGFLWRVNKKQNNEYKRENS